MAKQDIKLDTLVFPLPAAMISCGSNEEEHNIITIAWMGTICSNPPMCYISVRPERYSFDIIKRNMEFVINIPDVKLARETDWCGIHSGKNVDKFKELNLTKGRAKAVQAPYIVEAPLNIECRVKEILDLGSHCMFIADVLNIKVNDEYLTPNEKIDAMKLHPLVYSHRQYFELGEHIGGYGWTSKENKG